MSHPLTIPKESPLGVFLNPQRPQSNLFTSRADILPRRALTIPSSPLTQLLHKSIKQALLSLPLHELYGTSTIYGNLVDLYKQHSRNVQNQSSSFLKDYLYQLYSITRSSRQGEDLSSHITGKPTFDPIALIPTLNIPHMSQIPFSHLPSPSHTHSTLHQFEQKSLFLSHILFTILINLLSDHLLSSNDSHLQHSTDRSEHFSHPQPQQNHFLHDNALASDFSLLFDAQFILLLISHFTPHYSLFNHEFTAILSHFIAISVSTQYRSQYEFYLSIDTPLDRGFYSSVYHNNGDTQSSSTDDHSSPQSITPTKPSTSLLDNIILPPDFTTALSTIYRPVSSFVATTSPSTSTPTNFEEHELLIDLSPIHSSLLAQLYSIFHQHRIPTNPQPSISVQQQSQSTPSSVRNFLPITLSFLNSAFPTSPLLPRTSTTSHSLHSFQPPRNTLNSNQHTPTHSIPSFQSFPHFLTLIYQHYFSTTMSPVSSPSSQSQLHPYFLHQIHQITPPQSPPHSTQDNNLDERRVAVIKLIHSLWLKSIRESVYSHFLSISHWSPIIGTQTMTDGTYVEKTGDENGNPAENATADESGVTRRPKQGYDEDDPLDASPSSSQSKDERQDEILKYPSKLIISSFSELFQHYSFPISQCTSSTTNQITGGDGEGLSTNQTQQPSTIAIQCNLIQWSLSSPHLFSQLLTILPANGFDRPYDGTNKSAVISWAEISLMHSLCSHIRSIFIKLVQLHHSPSTEPLDHHPTSYQTQLSSHLSDLLTMLRTLVHKGFLLTYSSLPVETLEFTSTELSTQPTASQTQDSSESNPIYVPHLANQPLSILLTMVFDPLFYQLIKQSVATHHLQTLSSDFISIDSRHTDTGSQSTSATTSISSMNNVITDFEFHTNSKPIYEQISIDSTNLDSQTCPHFLSGVVFLFNSILSHYLDQFNIYRDIRDILEFAATNPQISSNLTSSPPSAHLQLFTNQVEQNNTPTATPSLTAAYFALLLAFTLISERPQNFSECIKALSVRFLKEEQIELINHHDPRIRSYFIATLPQSTHTIPIPLLANHNNTARQSPHKRVLPLSIVQFLTLARQPDILSILLEQITAQYNLFTTETSQELIDKYIARYHLNDKPAVTRGHFYSIESYRVSQIITDDTTSVAHLNPPSNLNILASLLFLLPTKTKLSSTLRVLLNFQFQPLTTVNSSSLLNISQQLSIEQTPNNEISDSSQSTQTVLAYLIYHRHPITLIQDIIQMSLSNFTSCTFIEQIIFIMTQFRSSWTKLSESLQDNNIPSTISNSNENALSSSQTSANSFISPPESTILSQTYTKLFKVIAQIKSSYQTLNFIFFNTDAHNYPSTFYLLYFIANPLIVKTLAQALSAFQQLCKPLPGKIELLLNQYYPSKFTPIVVPSLRALLVQDLEPHQPPIQPSTTPLSNSINPISSHPIHLLTTFLHNFLLQFNTDFTKISQLNLDYNTWFTTLSLSTLPPISSTRTPNLTQLHHFTTESPYAALLDPNLTKFTPVHTILSVLRPSHCTSLDYIRNLCSDQIISMLQDGTQPIADLIANEPFITLTPSTLPNPSPQPSKTRPPTLFKGYSIKDHLSSLSVANLAQLMLFLDPQLQSPLHRVLNLYEGGLNTVTQSEFEAQKKIRENFSHLEDNMAYILSLNPYTYYQTRRSGGNRISEHKASSVLGSNFQLEHVNIQSMVIEEERDEEDDDVNANSLVGGNTQTQTEPKPNDENTLPTFTVLRPDDFNPNHLSSDETSDSTQATIIDEPPDLSQPPQPRDESNQQKTVNTTKFDAWLYHENKSLLPFFRYLVMNSTFNAFSQPQLHSTDSTTIAASVPLSSRPLSSPLVGQQDPQAETSVCYALLIGPVEESEVSVNTLSRLIPITNLRIINDNGINRRITNTVFDSEWLNSLVKGSLTNYEKTILSANFNFIVLFETLDRVYQQLYAQNVYNCQHRVVSSIGVASEVNAIVENGTPPIVCPTSSLAYSIASYLPIEIFQHAIEYALGIASQNTANYNQGEVDQENSKTSTIHSSQSTPTKLYRSIPSWFEEELQSLYVITQTIYNTLYTVLSTSPPSQNLSLYHYHHIASFNPHDIHAIMVCLFGCKAIEYLFRRKSAPSSQLPNFQYSLSTDLNQAKSYIKSQLLMCFEKLQQRSVPQYHVLIKSLIARFVKQYLE